MAPQIFDFRPPSSSQAFTCSGGFHWNHPNCVIVIQSPFGLHIFFERITHGLASGAISTACCDNSSIDRASRPQTHNSSASSRIGCVHGPGWLRKRNSSSGVVAGDAWDVGMNCCDGGDSQPWSLLRRSIKLELHNHQTWLWKSLKTWPIALDDFDIAPVTVPINTFHWEHCNVVQLNGRNCHNYVQPYNRALNNVVHLQNPSMQSSCMRAIHHSIRQCFDAN